jgi:glutamate dehydrogenase/leucine dehydrogenase
MEAIEMKIVEEVVGDDIGPALMVHWYDPGLKVKGVMVVDSLALGMATGGTRMLPDITSKEIFMLARAMTYKKATMGVPVGGAKAGIWADPDIAPPRREAIFRAFGRALKPLFRANIVRYGEDMGVGHTDIEIVGQEAGYPPPLKTDFSREIREGEPLENHFTGYGVVIAARVACDFCGVDLSKATVAIEGFGKVGGGAARYFHKSGAKIVALSTIHGAIYNAKGLDVRELFEIRKKFGDKCILKYENAEVIKKEDLFYLPVDILVPGGRPYVINEENAERVQAKVISSGANVPITDEGLEILFRRGIHVVPDFIANSGGSTAGLSRRSGLTADQTFIAIEKIVGGNTKEILQASSKEKVNPTLLAKQRALEKVRRAMSGRLESIPHEIALKKFRELVGM